jgi:hypothetical protein
MMKSTGHIVRWMRTGSALLVSAAILLMTGLPLSNAATQPDGNRAFVQEGLGNAIVSAATARTPMEKARAQEILGTLIVQAALQGESLQSAVSISHPASSTVPTEWHETRGEAVSYIIAALGGTAMLIGAFFGFRLRKETVSRVSESAS